MGLYDRAMRVVAEIIVLCGAALVVATLTAIALRGARERALIFGVVLLAAASVAAAAGLAISLVRADGDWRIYGVALAALAAFSCTEVGLVALNRLRMRDLGMLALVEKSFKHIDERIADHSQKRAKELEQNLARERARSQHALTDQERELGEARRTAIAEAEQAAADDLLRRVGAAHDELGARVSGWSTDFARTQDEQARRIEEHDRVQRAALSSQRDRLDEHEKTLHDLASGRRTQVEEMRDAFSSAIDALGEELHRQLGIEEQHYHREIAQLSERLKAVSQALREDAYREELDARTRLAADIGEAERRVVATFEKSLERAADRISETAERRFDEQIRESRDETSTRLTSELERTRDAYAQQIEDEIETRMHEVARQTTQRLQRQLDQVVRQAESQTSTAEDRITFITQRLEAAMDTAAGRVAAFESELELELSSKLTEFERAVRHAEQSVGRETG